MTTFKVLTLTILSLFFLNTLNSQVDSPKEEVEASKLNDSSTDDAIYRIIDEMPRFAGCEDSKFEVKEKQDCAKILLLDYITEKVINTKNDSDEYIEGLYVVQFVVNKDGSLSDYNFVRTLANCSTCKPKILETLRGMPNWIPGIQNGRIVRTLYTLPIKFSKDN